MPKFWQEDDQGDTDTHGGAGQPGVQGDLWRIQGELEPPATTRFSQPGLFPMFPGRFQGFRNPLLQGVVSGCNPETGEPGGSPVHTIPTEGRLQCTDPANLCATRAVGAVGAAYETTIRLEFKVVLLSGYVPYCWVWTNLGGGATPFVSTISIGTR